MVKILAIGNSFSQDATRYMKEIAQSIGLEMLVVNLYIGGCSLEQHAQHIKDGEAAYVYERNGVITERYISLQEAVREEKWDIVTVQQVSGYSGMPETYEPYGTELLAFVKSHLPNAKLFFHMTWAYEQDSTHPHFANYENSQLQMYRGITHAAETYAKKNGLGFIPAGHVIQTLRQQPPFDYAVGGLSLCRDGFHMSLDYGRYAVAATWVEILLGGNVTEASFAPEGTDSALIECINSTVHAICHGM